MAIFCHKNVVCFLHMLHIFKCIPGKINRGSKINIMYGSAVVECLTRDRGAAGSSHTGVTLLCPLARILILA